MPQLHLPHLLASWPWPVRINPHYETVSREAAAWLCSFEAFPDIVQEEFNACNFGLLVAYAYPNLDRDQYRVVYDVMNFFFVMEVLTDDATRPDASDVLRVSVDVLEHSQAALPFQLDDGQPGSSDNIPLADTNGSHDKTLVLVREIVHQFWANAQRIVVPSAQVRFIRAWAAYCASVIEEATIRATNPSSMFPAGRYGSIQSYMQLRRLTIGCWPSFAMIGHALDDLTDDVLENPLVHALSELATEMICIGNDLVSYNKERPTGALHNIISIVLQHRPPWSGYEGHGHCDSTDTALSHPRVSTPQNAVFWAASYHNVLAQQFLQMYAITKQAAPQLGFSGGQTAALLAYIDGLGIWIRANDEWSYAGTRYFGRHGVEVKVTRVVELEKWHEK